METNLDILAFAAHPDDVELSASGTLMKHIDLGYRVGIVDLTAGELGTRGDANSRKNESSVASEVMGISVRENLAMKDGFFEVNEANKLLIIQQIRRFQPKIVLANAVSDRHPDHGRASTLVLEACFYAGLPKISTQFEGKAQYAFRPDAVYNYIQDYYIEPDFVVDITPYVERKMQAIMAYKTQFYDPASKEPKTPISGQEFVDFLKGRMAGFGRPIGAQFAEGFTVSRLPGVDNLMDLR